jgi:hypothetical protein
MRECGERSRRPRATRLAVEVLARVQHVHEELPGQRAVLRLQLADGIVGPERLAGV